MHTGPVDAHFHRVTIGGYIDDAMRQPRNCIIQIIALADVTLSIQRNKIVGEVNLMIVSKRLLMYDTASGSNYDLICPQTYFAAN